MAYDIVWFDGVKFSSTTCNVYKLCYILYWVIIYPGVIMYTANKIISIYIQFHLITIDNTISMSASEYEAQLALKYKRININLHYNNTFEYTATSAFDWVYKHIEN